MAVRVREDRGAWWVFIAYRGQRTKPLFVAGTSENWPYVNQLVIESGRFFNGNEVQRRQNVIVKARQSRIEWNCSTRRTMRDWSYRSPPEPRRDATVSSRLAPEA